MEYDYYKILGIARTASINDIKQAYRNMAKLYHPDVNAATKANDFFAIINDAYETLCDEKKRQVYDIKLNYIEALKKEAERKKQYYGSSVKNNTYTSNFHYDFESVNKAIYKEKTDEEYYKQSPILYNLFFVCGMFLGFLIITVTILGTINKLWPIPFVLICIPGIILVRGGWRGIMGKTTLLNRFLKFIKKE